MLSFLAKQIIKKYKPAIMAVILGDAEFDPRPAIATALSEQFVVASPAGAVKNKSDAISVILNAVGASALQQFFLALSLVWKKRADWPEIILVRVAKNAAMEEMEEFSEFLKFDFIVALPSDGGNPVFPASIERFLKKGARIIVKSSHQNLVPPLVKKSCRIITYSSPEADIFSSDMVLQSNGGVKGTSRFGISFKINYKGTVLPIRVSQSVNEKEVSNIMIASLVGLEMGINLVQITSSFRKYRPVGGMKVIEGIKHSAIIDDSAVRGAGAVLEDLNIFPKLKSTRKLVVLGDIFSLGLEAENKHREIGRKIFSIKPDLVFGAGNRVNFAVDELRRLRFPAERIFRFDNAREVEETLQPKIREDDLILVVGSKEAGLGKVVRQIMANP